MFFFLSRVTPYTHLTHLSARVKNLKNDADADEMTVQSNQQPTDVNDFYRK